MAWLSERRWFATQTGEFMNELVKGLSRNDVVTYPRIPLKKNQFFKWVYANLWPSLVGIWRIPAYHANYTTEGEQLRTDFFHFWVNYHFNKPGSFQTRGPCAADVTHLLALGSLEINVAVAFSAFGRGAQFAQFVCPSGFRQTHVPERPGVHHNLRLDAVYICKMLKRTVRNWMIHTD